MSKKKIIAILLFIFIGLFMFAFANPGDLEKEQGKSDVDVDTEENINKEEDKAVIELEPSGTKEVSKQNSTLILDPNGDEDKDGYTNKEEQDNNSDPLDPNSKPFDNIAPIIILNGDASIVLIQGDEYEDLGATAKDNLDGDITDKIVTVNLVDTAKVDTYEVTYTVEDRAGNVTMEKREVRVASYDGDEDKDGYTNGEERENGSDPFDPESKPVDNEAPVITLNGENPVVLLEGEEYKEAGAQATDNLDGDITDKIVTDSDVNTEKAGDYEVTYTVEDRAGNKGVEVRDVKVLSRNGDEDQDGYTNEEEKDNGTDPLDSNSKPVDNAPVITVNPTEVKIVEGVSYDVMTGVNVEDDFDTLTVTADITETNTLSTGDHTITYTAQDRAGNKDTETRKLIVLSRNGDEDQDGYTNGEEVDNGSDPFDPNSKPVDREAPVITLNGENPVVLLEGEEYKEAGAQATDNLDGNITDRIVTTNGVNTQKAGDYEVTYTVEDRAGNKGVEVRDVKVLSRNGDEDQDGYTNEEEKENGTDPLDPNSKPVDNAPIITVNPTEVKIVEGVSYDVMTGVSVEDDFDTLTVSANITETNTLSTGDHTITYTVKDRAGNTDTETRKMIILSRNGDEDQDGYTNGEEKDNGTDPLDPNSKPVDREAPVITLNGENPVVLLEGEEYKEAGAQATDNLDGDITDKIVTDSDINTQKAGDYEVTYTVEDRAGNKGVEVRDVKVLSRNGDEDQDGYTNEEEKDNGTDPLDPNSKPVDNAPVITVNPTEVKIVEGVSYDVMTGVNVEDDFDTLTVTADITETNTLSTGDHTITYTAQDRAGNKDTETRKLIVLSRNGDEDQDGYTNGEEKDNGTDPLDPNSKPVDNAPVITVNPNFVEINEDESYDVMTGVSAKDDFDIVTVSADITDTSTLIPGTHTITYTTTSDRSGQVGTETRTIVVKAVDKEPPVITANDVNANGQPEAIININVVDTGSGVKEVHYLPKAYDSVKDYIADVNSSTQPVDPINLTLDENGNATIMSYFDTTYTIYAVDNKGNATVKKVSTTGIEQSKEDIVDDGSATIESIKGATITVGKNTTKGYFLNFLKLNPKRDIKVTANEGYEIQSVKWSIGRQNLQYFQDGNGNVEYLEFTLGDSRYTNVYTLYVKTKNTTTNEIYEGVSYIYNNAYWFWIARI